MPRPRTAFASAVAATIAACLTFARPTAALVFAEPRDLRAEGPPRPSERGVLVDRLSAHALAADAADAAAEALRLPLSTGTRFDAQSLSSSPDLRVGARHARPRGTRSPRGEDAAGDARGDSLAGDTADSPVRPRVLVETYLETYVGAGASDGSPTRTPRRWRRRRRRRRRSPSTARILAEYEAAMAAFAESERALRGCRGRSGRRERARPRCARAVTGRGGGGGAGRAWAEAHGTGPSGANAEDSERLLSSYAKAACTQTIHHKPVYVPGVFTPPKLAPSVKIPGTPPVFVPGAPAFWEPGRAPFFTPGFWTPGKPPRYVGAVRPTIVPAKKGVVIPGEFVPPSYTPGFVIPGWHETTACAVPVCVAPCQDAPVEQPDIVAR